MTVGEIGGVWSHVWSYYGQSVPALTLPVLQPLKKSEAAKVVFEQLRRLLDTKPGAIAAKEWRTTFEALEVSRRGGRGSGGRSAQLRPAFPDRGLAALPRQLGEPARLHLRPVDHLPHADREQLHGHDPE